MSICWTASDAQTVNGYTFFVTLQRNFSNNMWLILVYMELCLQSDRVHKLFNNFVTFFATNFYILDLQIIFYHMILFQRCCNNIKHFGLWRQFYICINSLVVYSIVCHNCCLGVILGITVIFPKRNYLYS